MGFIKETEKVLGKIHNEYQFFSFTSTIFGGEKKVRLTNLKEVFSCQSEFTPSLYRLLVGLWTGDGNQQGLNDERKLTDSFDFC